MTHEVKSLLDVTDTVHVHFFDSKDLLFYYYFFNP